MRENLDYAVTDQHCKMYQRQCCATNETNWGVHISQNNGGRSGKRSTGRIKIINLLQGLPDTALNSITAESQWPQSGWVHRHTRFPKHLKENLLRETCSLTLWISCRTFMFSPFLDRWLGMRVPISDFLICILVSGQYESHYQWFPLSSRQIILKGFQLLY